MLAGLERTAKSEEKPLDLVPPRRVISLQKPPTTGAAIMPSARC